MRLVLPFLLFAGLVLVAYRPVPPPASPPALAVSDTAGGFENLHVLPDSISHDALMAVMDRFTEALGVRCSYCHVRAGEDWNFAADDRGHKRITREMMRLTTTLNQGLLPAIEGLHGGAVTCWTCHRGAALPDTAPPREYEEDGEYAPSDESPRSDH